jgi:hypothetical protein
MTDIKTIRRRFARAKESRSVWESTWQDVADMVRPEASFTGGRTPGDNSQRIPLYDDTGAIASSELAAGLDSMLTNPSIRWFSLVPIDPGYEMDDEDDRGLFAATEVMLRHFDSPLSGFATAVHEVYMDLCDYGSGCLMFRDEPGKVVRYQARALKSIYVEEDDDGEVVGVFRSFELRAWEMIEKFGRENVHDRVIRAEERDADEKFEMVNHTWRRSSGEREYNKVDSANMPWGSCYADLTCGKVVRESGFRQNPYVTPRFEKLAEEVYGRSPAMRALPSMRTQNSMAKAVLHAAEMAIRPPMMVPANGMEGSFSTKPGSVNYYRAGSKDRPEPMITGVRPDFGEAELERRGARIDRTFFADRFRLPESDRMTATEIVARRQQGLMAASPVLGRMYAEFLHPIISMTYRAFVERQYIAPAPIPVGIAYTSPLAASRRVSEADAFNDTMVSVIPVANIDPTVMDNFDKDYAVRKLASYRNLDPRFMRPRGEVRKLRAQQAKLAQAGSMAGLAETASGAAKNFAQAGKGASNA